jgi:hypothetical protein
VGVDAARVKELEEQRRALAQEAKRFILSGIRSDRQPTSAERRARLTSLLREAEVVDAELERAFRAPPG